ncbi:MAG: bifunctional 4-hydroxy-2-oxoglutarate aldolase/2-dehydro-3-deoxy-phosphogluconate aldolase [Succinivibrionaceae bacterium]|nr:bifunctional 4-hydroxy-2-oxoglutarate aldolase/2-dehydro-3-deoxy-phosphogluconate aldolase [Succinivibrionaceae bacterium]
MADILEQISEYGVVPLVTLDDPEDAVPLAGALRDGGIPIAEVTFRTAAGGECIRRMAKAYPDLLVGAGTVHDVDHAKETLDSGGKFVITPGFNPKVVDWCLKNNMPVCPGTVTPADLEQALDFGLKVVKFFPAGAYGGVNTLKALAGPYAALKFVPTGGVNLDNLTEFLDLPNVAAAGGSFVPPSKQVKAKDWKGVADTCRAINDKVLGFSVGHVGINAGTPEAAKQVGDCFASIFGGATKDTPIAFFAGEIAEVMKQPFHGEKGHICVDTRDLRRALAMFRRKGIEVVEREVCKDESGKPVVLHFLKDEIGGFAVHVRQRAKR